MAKPQQPDDTTHFGYQSVKPEEKAGLVRDVFDSVASRYDIMNDVMSAGLHRLWKRFTVDQAALKSGDVVLDLAGGTGDLARAFCGKVGKQGHVVLADINAAMLQQGRSRLVDAGVAGNLSIAQVDAQQLPFADGTFDCISDETDGVKPQSGKSVFRRTTIFFLIRFDKIQDFRPGVFTIRVSRKVDVIR